MPRARISCLFHFAALAAMLAIARVLLNTISASLFLYHEGPDRLPLFYFVLAVATVLLSLGLSMVIDRLARIKLAQMVFAGCLLWAAALHWPVELDMPGAYFVLLASGHIYEIVLDIVLWVVIAGFTDSVEFRRATPFIYICLAIGGAVGGGAAHLLSALLSTVDMLLVLPVLAAVLVAQLGLIGRRLDEVPDHDPPDRSPAGIVEAATSFVGLVRRFPLSLLIALNALVMTLLYGLSEYLVFSIYSAQFPEQHELTRFLALVFALLQTIEFALLYAVSWPLLERAAPLVRNLVFPITSFAGLVYLIASQKLPAALVLHVNAEAVSNAIYQPVSNANYIPLPLRFQGRARTLADGVFYPTGLALAGGILVLVPEQGVTAVVGFIAIVFALVFVLLGVGIGLLFLPTLRANLGAGLITPGQAIAAEAVPAPRVRALLQSREAELRLLGLSFAAHVDPRALEDDLLALATHPDRTTRAALARLVAAAPRSWAEDFLDRCLAGSTEEQAKLALAAMLIRRTPLPPRHAVRVFSAQDQAVVALGHIVAEGLAARPRVEPLIREWGVASELVEAILCAERTELLPLLLACLAMAEPEQQLRALVLLNGSTPLLRGLQTDPLRPLARSGDAAVRAETIVLLSRTMSRPAAVRELVAALDDPDRRVRRRAAAALCEHGDRATALLRRRLAALTVGTGEAVWTAARIGSPAARRLLADLMRKLQQDTEHTARLLDRIATSPERARWWPLELCLRDHRAGVVDIVMTAILPALEDRLARRVRQALQSEDQRSRASAFELLNAVPASRVTPGAVALLRHLLFEDGAPRPVVPGPNTPEDLLDEAKASLSPWVRRAAALLTAPSCRSPAGLPASVTAEASDPTGAPGMPLDDQEFERVLALKRTPLFRHVPFETMVEVARSGQPRVYLAGEEVIAERAVRQDLLVLEAGALSLEHREGAATLVGPACFGEAALVGERISWPRITALEESRVWFLRAALFQELCGEHPEIAIELCKVLARRLREAGAIMPR